MNNIVDQFIGLDPILGDQAKDDLIKYGENSLDLIISRFGSCGEFVPGNMESEVLIDTTYLSHLFQLSIQLCIRRNGEQRVLI